MDERTAQYATAEITKLWHLYGPSLRHASSGRLDRRQPSGPAQNGDHRNSFDGRRPVHDDVASAALSFPTTKEKQNQQKQDQHHHAGRHAVRAWRPPPRPCVLRVLCRHQSWRFPVAVDRGLAGRGLWLALWLRCRRSGNGGRTDQLPLRLARLARRASRRGSQARANAAYRRSMEIDRRTDPAGGARYTVVGLL